MGNTVDRSRIELGLRAKVPALHKAKEFIVHDASGAIQVVKKEDLLHANPDHIVKAVPKPLQRDIIDGANVAERYLQAELPRIFEFLEMYGGGNPSVRYDMQDSRERWLQIEMPLPPFYVDEGGKKHRFSYDKEVMVFVLNDYPDMPPIGFYISKRSANLDLFKKIFKSHIYDKALLERPHVSDALQRDWEWICFHYQNQNWTFDLEEGDNLANFIYYIYAKLCGLEGVSHE